jgi:chorismate dehydratase
LILRISLVHYLNAAPLGWYFLHGPDRAYFRVLPSSPASCADQLAAGEADIGLIPSIEYQRIPDLHVIPGVSISAIQEVRSVLLVRPHGLAEIQSVALDTSSRTSITLLKLLLEHRLNIRPKFVPHEPDLREMLRKCDAALIIGDAALRCAPEDYEILDLAAAWRAWQNLPFVFAFWACRQEVVATNGLAGLFQQAKDWGVAKIDDIAAEYSRRLQLPAAFLERYLRRNLDHTMSPEHVAGVNRFHRLAFESGLIDSLRPIRFVQ